MPCADAVCRCHVLTPRADAMCQCRVLMPRADAMCRCRVPPPLTDAVPRCPRQLARPRGAGRGAGAGAGVPARLALLGGGRHDAGGAARVHGLRRRLPDALHPPLPGELPRRLRRRAAGEWGRRDPPAAPICQDPHGHPGRWDPPWVPVQPGPPHWHPSHQDPPRGVGPIRTPSPAPVPLGPP